MLSWPSARASCLFSGCFVLISQDLTIGDSWTRSLRIAAQGKRGSIAPEGSQESLWVEMLGKRGLVGCRCLCHGLYCRGQLRQGVGLERGDASHTGGVPVVGDTQRSKVLTCRCPGSAGRSPVPSCLEPVKGRGTWRSWGGPRGWADGGWWSRVLLCTSFEPNLAGFGEVSGPWAVPGDTPMFQCQP